jgi:hypothetical protein
LLGRPIKQPYDFDSVPSAQQLFEQLRLNRTFWDFSEILKQRSSPFPLAGFFYEYTRQMNEPLLAAALTEAKEALDKLKVDFAGEWPLVPFTLTKPEHSYLFIYQGWPERKEKASFIFDPSRPLNENRRLFVECWKDQQRNGKDPRGNGGPERSLRNSLRWLGHARLWGLIKWELTAGWGVWGVGDGDRFQLYQEFLELEHRLQGGDPSPEALKKVRYSTLAKLKVAVLNSSLITENLLCEKT